jgi:Leucine-rich repeat (LRR) protein
LCLHGTRWDNKDLVSIDVSHNLITSVPEDIARVESLETLIISYNKLSALPSAALAKLANLGKLQIDHNMLARLDSKLFEGKLNLRELKAQHNKISGALPESTGRMVSCMLWHVAAVLSIHNVVWSRDFSRSRVWSCWS